MTSHQCGIMEQYADRPVIEQMEKRGELNHHLAVCLFQLDL